MDPEYLEGINRKGEMLGQERCYLLVADLDQGVAACTDVAIAYPVVWPSIPPNVH